MPESSFEGVLKWRHLAAGVLTIHLPKTSCMLLEFSIEGHAPGKNQSGGAHVWWTHTLEELLAQGCVGGLNCEGCLSNFSSSKSETQS